MCKVGRPSESQERQLYVKTKLTVGLSKPQCMLALSTVGVPYVKAGK